MNKNDLIHRAIPVQVSDEHPDGFIRVRDCRECKFYHHEGEYCEISDIDWIKYSTADKIIHKSCPLLTVAQVREYPASEKPEKEKRIQITFKHRTGNVIRIGEYSGGGAWYTFGWGRVFDSDVVSWKHISED